MAPVILRLILPFALVCLAAAETTPVEFSRDVEPIFRTRCQGCHGAKQQMSGLRLDRGEDAMRGGYSGAVIVPRKSADSRLIQMVAGAVEGRIMPPAGEKLSAAEIGVLRAWIDQGAVWPAGSTVAATVVRPKSSHWSLQPIQRPAIPAVRTAAWVRNPIDAFILERLESEKIAPAPEADKNTLLRRLSLDLIGLPPTPAEVAAFLADKSSDAYERAVDRLMASPHYGEKWARHWLDQARYADSDGYEKDSRRPHAWRYRQWVIDAFNRDMPFDQFTVEQIAGDLLPGATIEQRVATGFHRNTLTNREGGVNINQFRFEQLVDRAAAVGTVWLGLTVGCAQCHDHKYDPISQKDFYQLFAFFNNAEEVNIEAPMAGEQGPYLRARNDYYRERRKLLDEYKVTELQPEWERKMIAAADTPGKWTDLDVAFDTVQKMVDGGEKILRTPPAQRTRHQQDAITDHMVRWYSQVSGDEKFKELKFKELRKKLADLEAAFPDLSQAQTLAESPEHQPTYLRVRGDWRQNGVEVHPNTPAVLPALTAAGEANRLTLARWIVGRDNPLMARVAVNRMWQELFGQGLVATSEDFGTQGARPSHPQLLDWLAGDFMDGGWGMKRMVKRMVMSAAYRQSSAARHELDARDPNNTLIARQSAFRLPAELIRDSVLSASGLLYPAIGGKSVQPPLPEAVVKLAFGNNDWVTWKETTGPERYRRGMYITYQRTIPYPVLANFDAPDAGAPSCRRQRSNTPLQALNLLNDPVFVEAAQALAERTLREAPADSKDRIAYAFELCLARKPAPAETDRLLGYFERQKSILAAEPESATKLYPVEPEKVTRVEAAAWVGLSRVLLNLDEFLTRE
ncbi:MAG: PSD1 domain-containing protein [Candidatus Solibacter usitatus]|nr:PSD1 domain-containing protein [Candidatus Solibacter usitatus]